MGFLSRDIGIDLGTANTLVTVRGKSTIISEPSVVALNTKTGAVLAVGNEAKDMIGRTPGDIVAIRPMKDGVIADFDITRTMLKYFIDKALPGVLKKPRVCICVPSGVTEVEKRAVVEASRESGAKETVLVEEPMAAAIGANLPIDEPSGSMIVDIGGGTSEVAVISLGGIVTSESLRVAGDELDEAIVHYMKKEYNLMIGERTAEYIKINIGAAYELEQNDALTVRGRDLITGLPKNVTIFSHEVTAAIKESVNAIVDAIKVTLEKTPPELAADVMDRGIMLSGGGALLRGLDRLIYRETGIPVAIADRPLECVALGARKVLENFEILKKVQIAPSR